MPLEHSSNPGVGETRLGVAQGDLRLDDYLVHAESRAQGFIVVHRGKVAFEAYPGMRDFDAPRVDVYIQDDDVTFGPTAGGRGKNRL